MNILQQARLGVNLTPGQRAFLRFAEMLLAGAALAGLQAAYPLLSATGDVTAINWGGVWHTFLSAFLLALYMGLSKYWKAQGDAPLTANGPAVAVGDYPPGIPANADGSSVIASMMLPATVLAPDPTAPEAPSGTA